MTKRHFTARLFTTTGSRSTASSSTASLSTATRSCSTASCSSATRSEITLFCLVHGEPSSSCFGVTIGNNEDINGLRELIKEEIKPEFDGIASRRIKLWMVDIPFNSPNLGDSSVNIANVLQGREFLLPKKVGDIFTVEPAKDCIHIIVEMPALSAAAFSYISQDKINEIHEMLRNLTQQTIKNTISISKISTGNFQNLTNHLKFKIEEVTFGGLHSRASPPAFEWGETSESLQKDEHLKWIRGHIPLTGKFVWYDVEGDQHLLDLLRNSRLPFNVSGGTDVAVVNDYNVDSDMIQESIYAVLKLKKRIERKDMRPVILAMIVADLITPKSRNVFGILTDLINDWRIYWLEDDRTIKCWKAPSRGVAVQVIKNLLGGNSAVNMGNIPAAKRVKLDTLLTNHNTTVDDVVRMEDVYNVMSKKEIMYHKVGIASEIVRNIPSFMTMEYLDYEV